MARAFYNQLTGTLNADSAGTDVDHPGQTIEERKEERLAGGHNFYLLDVMNEVGIDISKAKRTQLTEPMLAHYDKIVSIAEKEESPEWLLSTPGVIYWDIEDPRGQDFAANAMTRDLVRKKVIDLVREDGS
jgi:protein-tyrosine-phosphatase